jgi:hypothetical protein
MPDASTSAFGERYPHVHSFPQFIHPFVSHNVHPNSDPIQPARLPNPLELAQLTSPEGLLPATLVPLLPLKELRRRAHEINVTHQQYRFTLSCLFSQLAQETAINCSSFIAVLTASATAAQTWVKTAALFVSGIPRY